WLSCCNDRHGRGCKSPLRSFKPDNVIDCVSRSVVLTPPGSDYIALSYVWGKPHGNSQDLLISDFQKLPATIRDAIAVVLALGYRYLWIDRYCIEQTDSLARNLQIQQMGNIYNNASVTIIAAAGSSPYYGLPGVSQMPRIAQPRETILGSTIVGFPDHPRESIQNSVWNTRAWTYQEALLSRRRLIFSEQQVYFECQKSCRE
ncbi:heterokaryon incompatibility protein-domain-containing protein, partial [Leptodontidium sp. 2 PMI_412]